MDGVLAAGSFVWLTAMSSGGRVNYNHVEEALKASGRGEFVWEVRREKESDLVRLCSVPSGRFLQITEGLELVAMQEESVACDLRVHSSSECLAFEFASMPGCFAGFEPSGKPKPCSHSSVHDLFQWNERSAPHLIHNEFDAEITRAGEKLPEATFHMLPAGLVEDIAFDRVCALRAAEFRNFSRELKVS